MAQSESALAGKRCLVLDDELLIAVDIQQILEAAGATNVVCLGTAEDALAALNRGPHFDVAVLDIVLRGGARDSLSVASMLAAQKTPFVFLTGMRWVDAHATPYPTAPMLEKPYQPPLLIAAVLRALATR